MQSSSTSTIETFAKQEYKYGFVTDIESETPPPGLNEDVVRFISAKKDEPEWLLEWRLKAYRHWLTMKEPTLGRTSTTRRSTTRRSSTTRRPSRRRTGRRAWTRSIPSCSRPTRSSAFRCTSARALAGRGRGRRVRQRLRGHHVQGEAGRDGRSSSARSREAVQEHPELVRKYLGSVVPYTDNFFATLNSAVFTDGSFVLHPQGRALPDGAVAPISASTPKNTGQFERTLIVADEGAYVSYLEGCTAPMRDENQLHAAVVELVALDNAQIKYSTVQNWYPGDKDGKGGIYNFVTKRGKCRGANSKISWTQVETGSAITWKYPSCILKGDDSRRRVLLRGADQQLPAGRHRHQDDPHRQEHAAAPSSPRASPPATARTPTAAW